jgi:hypothetical protein
MSQSEIELRSWDTSNVDLDATCESLLPKLEPTKICGLLVIDHKPIGFFCGE